MKRNPNPKILANALFKISEQNNALDDVNTSLIFLNDLIENERLFCVFLQSKKINRDEKRNTLNIVLGQNGHPLVNEMVSYIYGSKALSILNDTFRVFHLKYRKALNILEIKGTVASEISSSKLKSFQESLELSLGRKAELSIEVDPTLIGGIKLRINNTYLDASIQNQLRLLQNELL